MIGSSNDRMEQISSSTSVNKHPLVYGTQDNSDMEQDGTTVELSDISGISSLLKSNPKRTDQNIFDIFDCSDRKSKHDTSCNQVDGTILSDVMSQRKNMTGVLPEVTFQKLRSVFFHHDSSDVVNRKRSQTWLYF